ncbi:MAG: hypothetical protein R6X25_09745 [Candidatus Krumholzibacteriia bacterium]
MAAVLGAAFVLLLAVGALLLPDDLRLGGRPAGRLLVLDPLAIERGDVAFGPLADWLAAATGLDLQLELVTSSSAMQADVLERAAVVFCPDLTAIALDSGFVPVAAANRRIPYNLQPRPVLIYRKAAGRREAPWNSDPGRTVLGDTLTLAALGGVLAAGDAPPAAWAQLRCAAGPDPFDHRLVLHAARLGCFDYALVREWAARSFLEAQLVDEAEWGIDVLDQPVPDYVVMTSRRLGTADRERLRDALLQLRGPDERDSAARAAAVAGLQRVGLSGFVPLLETALDRSRSRLAGRWPSPAG